MQFSSIVFLFIFLPVTLILYYLTPKRWKNLTLLLCSLVFYAWGEPVYLLLMVLSILCNYFIGLDIDRKRKRKREMKRIMVLAVVLNLGILVFFKYYGGFVKLPFPIGLSFFSLQILSYLIDVYRGTIKVQKSLVTFGTVVMMFPKLLAGPVMRYGAVEKQLQSRELALTKFGQGAEYVICGLAKKVLLADTIGLVYTEVAAMPKVSVLTAWIGCAAFTFQIYFDFSGYSDIAVGLGKMLGFELMRNFDYPYLAKSITEFWRRWHKSLGSWFREYVYLPLGGNHVSVPRHLLNLLIVWLLIGVWHGAGRNFSVEATGSRSVQVMVIWGIYYGVILIIEKYITGKWIAKLPEAVRVLYSMLLVMIGWVIFFSNSLKDAAVWLGHMFGAGASALIDRQALYLLQTNWMLWIAVLLGSTPIVHRLFFALTHGEGQPRPVVGTAVYMGLFLICIAYLVTGTYHPFLYFRF